MNTNAKKKTKHNKSKSHPVKFCLWLMPQIILGSGWFVVAACVKTKSSQINYDPNSQKWTSRPQSSPTLLEFLSAHTRYTGFERALAFAKATKDSAGFSFSFGLGKPQITGFSLDSVGVKPSPVSETSATVKPSLVPDNTTAMKPSASAPSDSFTLIFTSVGEPVTLVFNFAEPADSTTWASYVKKLAAPLATQEPAKPILGQLETALAGSSNGKVEFSFDYKEASVLTVFLWPALESDFLKTL